MVFACIEEITVHLSNTNVYSVLLLIVSRNHEKYSIAKLQASPEHVNCINKGFEET
jgi:hypothetical protein